MILDFIKKEKMKMKRRRIIRIIQKNCAWIITGLTFLGVIMSNILKFIEYLTSEVYFYYYGLDHNLYNYSDKNYIYNLCLSIIFLVAFAFLLYCIKQIIDDIKCNRNVNKTNVANILIIIISNIYLVFKYCYNLNYFYKIINFIIFIIFEIIVSIITFKEDDNKYKNKEKKEIVINYFKSLIFIIILWIFCNSGRTIMNLKSVKKYMIINDNKVIVYSNNDYYITLDCRIKNNNLIIYKGHQEKIDNTNIYSISKTFDDVKLK